MADWEWSSDWEWSNDECDVLKTPGVGDNGSAVGRNYMFNKDDNHMVGGNNIQLAVLDSVVWSPREKPVVKTAWLMILM